MIIKLLIAVFFAVLTSSAITEPMLAKEPNVIQRGGPYMSKDGKAIQSFNSPVYIDGSTASQPMTLTVVNGPNGQRPFAWVRIFLTDGSSNSATSAPKGRLLVNEFSFRNKSSIDIPMTNVFNRGTNGLFITGAGVQGASVMWTLKGLGGQSSGGSAQGVADTSSGLNLAKIEPRTALAGSEVTLSGSGFGASGANVSAMLTQKYSSPVKLTVSAVTPASMRLAIPNSVASGPGTLVVTAKGVASNPLIIDVLGMPEITGCNFQGGPVGQQFIFTVKNMSAPGLDIKCSCSLSGDPKDKDNPSVAANIKTENKTEQMSITMPAFPMLGDSPFFNPPKAVYVYVKVNGVDAKNSPYTIYCSRAPW